MDTPSFMVRFLTGLGFFSLATRTADAQTTGSDPNPQSIEVSAADTLTTIEKAEWGETVKEVAAFFKQATVPDLEFTDADSVLCAIKLMESPPRIIVNEQFAKNNHEFRDFLAAHEIGHLLHFESPGNKLDYLLAALDAKQGNAEAAHAFDRSVEQFTDSLATVYVGKDKAVAFFDAQILQERQSINDAIATAAAVHPQITIEQDSFIRVEITPETIGNLSLFSDESGELAATQIVLAAYMAQNRLFEDMKSGRFTTQDLNSFLVKKEDIAAELEQQFEGQRSAQEHGSLAERGAYVAQLNVSQKPARSR